MEILSIVKLHAGRINVPSEFQIPNDLTPIPTPTEFIFLDSLSDITLNSSPVFLGGVEGKSINIFNSGNNIINLIQSATNGVILPSGTLFELSPGQSAGFIFKSGKWYLLHSNKLINFVPPPSEVFIPVEAEDASLIASEPLNAGDLVNIFSDNGVNRCRKADNRFGYERLACGFVKNATSFNTQAKITTKDGSLAYFSSNNLQLEKDYYLGENGELTLNPPTSDTQIDADKLIQYIGRPFTESLLAFRPQIIAINKFGEN